MECAATVENSIKLVDLVDTTNTTYQIFNQRYLLQQAIAKYYKIARRISGYG